MRNLILLVAVLFSLTACMRVDYSIKGTITGDSEVLKSGKVYLENVDRSMPIRDTADIIEGEFVFEGTVLTPEQYVISVVGLNGVIEIFVENDDYVITGSELDLRGSEVKGGHTQQLLVELKAKYDELETKYDTQKMVAEYNMSTTLEKRKEEILAEYDKFTAEVNSIEGEILDSNPLSHFSLQSLYRKVDEMDFTKVKEKLDAFKADAEFEANRFVMAIEEQVAVLERLQVGQMAPDFILKDPSGKEIALSDVYKKNKITMIDFWAGWCPPCRKFNPELVRIYNQFKGQGFQILGVSMDRDRDTWLKAIKDDKLTWPQVSDVKSWDTEPVRLYNIKSIPQNVFVDQEGRIMARKMDKDKIVEFLKANL